MSLNSDNNKNNDKKEDNENKRTRRMRRTYQRNDKPPIVRPMGVSALSIASIAAAVVMLSSGAYFIAYAPSIHAEWHTSSRQSSSYSLANPAYLIPSLLVHISEADIATFGWVKIALASVPALVSFGLFRGRSWSWNTSIIFFAVTSVSLLLTFSSRGGGGGSIEIQEEEIAVNSVVQSLVYAGLSIAALYYLTRPRVKTFFGKNIATNDDNNSGNSMQHQSPTVPSS